MLIECRDYLVKKLKAAGIKTTPITSRKKLEISHETRVGAVLSGDETFSRSGIKKRYTDSLGAQHKRRKVFTREPVFTVIIGDSVPEKAEEILENFLRELDRGIYIDGNYTEIEVGEAEWEDEGDSILRSKLAVILKITFTGGVYRDSRLARIKDVEVIEVRKETHDEKDE